MGSLKKLSSIGAALLVSTSLASGAAFAADILPEPPIVEVPEVVTPIPTGGWYLRGDITYDYQDIDGVNYSVPGGTQVDFTSAEVDDAFNVGVGIGYQINDYFRVDATAEYVFDTDFRGTTSGTCPDTDAGDGLPGAPCTSVDTTSYTKFKVMANAYADLGNYHGFTPYIGAGIGGAYVDYDQLINNGTCTQTAGTHSPCPTTGGFTGTGATSTFTDTHEGVGSWRFAWALHAGASYDLSQNLKLDVGYTYSRIEGGDMFDWLDGSGTQGHDEGFEDHIIHAGLRYHLW